MKGKRSIFIKSLFALGIALQFTMQSAFAQSCPAGWNYLPFGGPQYPAGCRANKPSSDYHYYSQSSSRFYPYCGGNGSNGYRIPVLPSFEPLPISTISRPNSSRAYGSSNPNVFYTRGKLNDPTIPDDSAYLYDSLTRCVCADPKGQGPRYTISATPSDIGTESYTFASAPGNTITTPSGDPRIYPDTFETISSQDQNASKRYNMVAYGPITPSGSASDGRPGSVFNTASFATCGCPNINEYPTLNGRADSNGGIVGYYCAPKITSALTAGRVLTTYSAPLSGNVITVADEGPGTAGPVVPKILIPNINGESVEYNRKIWTCAEPYTLNQNGNSSTCVAPVQTSHQCDATSIGPYENGNVQGLINRKLACCLNENSPPGFTSGTRLKFDCADNSSVTYSNFNDLWLSKDDANQGGKSNALLLTNALGDYVTGFYTLNGDRCEQFSEFTAQPAASARLSKNAQGVWVETTSTLAGIPASVENLALSVGGTIPTTTADKLRCPIVVRAAMVATCPQNPLLPVAQKSWNFGTTATPKVQCAAAASVQVHIRIEQIYEIEGYSTMKPIDTILDKRQANSINVDKILADKNGTNCPIGTSKLGQSCAYQ